MKKLILAFFTLCMISGSVQATQYLGIGSIHPSGKNPHKRDCSVAAKINSDGVWISSIRNSDRQISVGRVGGIRFKNVVYGIDSTFCNNRDFELLVDEDEGKLKLTCKATNRNFSYSVEIHKEGNDLTFYEESMNEDGNIQTWNCGEFYHKYE